MDTKKDHNRFERNPFPEPGRKGGWPDTVKPDLSVNAMIAPVIVTIRE